MQRFKFNKKKDSNEKILFGYIGFKFIFETEKWITFYM